MSSVPHNNDPSLASPNLYEVNNGDHDGWVPKLRRMRQGLQRQLSQNPSKSRRNGVIVKASMGLDAYPVSSTTLECTPASTHPSQPNNQNRTRPSQGGVFANMRRSLSKTYQRQPRTEPENIPDFPSVPARISRTMERDIEMKSSFDRASPEADSRFPLRRSMSMRRSITRRFSRSGPSSSQTPDEASRPSKGKAPMRPEHSRQFSRDRAKEQHSLDVSRPLISSHSSKHVQKLHPQSSFPTTVASSSTAVNTRHESSSVVGSEAPLRAGDASECEPRPATAPVESSSIRDIPLEPQLQRIETIAPEKLPTLNKTTTNLPALGKTTTNIRPPPGRFNSLNSLKRTLSKPQRVSPPKRSASTRSYYTLGTNLAPVPTRSASQNSKSLLSSATAPANTPMNYSRPAPSSPKHAKADFLKIFTVPNLIMDGGGYEYDYEVSYVPYQAVNTIHEIDVRKSQIVGGVVSVGVPAAVAGAKGQAPGESTEFEQFLASARKDAQNEAPRIINSEGVVQTQQKQKQQARKRVLKVSTDGNATAKETPALTSPPVSGIFAKVGSKAMPSSKGREKGVGLGEKSTRSGFSGFSFMRGDDGGWMSAKPGSMRVQKFLGSFRRKRSEGSADNADADVDAGNDGDAPTNVPVGTAAPVGSQKRVNRKKKEMPTSRGLKRYNETVLKAL